jgi:uncharacterized protein YtpQ (UPF0354 family)
MDDRDALIDDIAERCRATSLDVEREGDTIHLSRGRGGGESSASIDPTDFVDDWLEADDRNRDRALAGYVSGLRHALLEPADSDADTWDFSESAGRLLMRIETESFESGAEAAAGEAPWTQPFHGDLRLVFLMELDMGMRVLDETQFDHWGVTPDRVVEGARSMLYHKADQTAPMPLEDYEGVEQLRVGDGCDAARALVLDELFFGEWDDTSRIALPGSDELLFVRSGDDATVAALKEATAEFYDEAKCPLTTSLFRFEKRKPVPVGNL